MLSVVLFNKKFCIMVRGNSVKSRGTTPHTLPECLLVAGRVDGVSHARNNCWFIEGGE